jgi:DNA helicase HerA-like ATPase
LLDATGTPEIVERALICPPHSQIGPISPDQRNALIKSSVVAGQYEKVIDRESAYEKLKERTVARVDAAPPPEPERRSEPYRGTRTGRQSDTIVEAMAKSVLRAAGSQIGREVIRGVLGSILGGRSR